MNTDDNETEETEAMSDEINEVDELDEAKLVERTWPYVLKLRHPFEFGKRLVTELTFRRGRMGDADGIQLRDSIPAGDLMLIASRLSEEPLKLIKMLDVEDAGEVTDIALDFYVRFLRSRKGGTRR